MLYCYAEWEPGVCSVPDNGDSNRYVSVDVRNRSFNIALMQNLLRPGRLAILGDFQYPGVAQRFRVIAANRLFGDGSGSGTTVSLIDPSVGRHTNNVWQNFYDADEGNSFLVDPHFVVGH